MLKESMLLDVMILSVVMLLLLKLRAAGSLAEKFYNIKQWRVLSKYIKKPSNKLGFIRLWI